MVKVLGPDPKIKEKEKKRKETTALIAAAQHSIQSILGSAAPTPMVKLLRKLGRGGVTEDHRTSHLSRVIVYHRPPTAASTSQQQAVEVHSQTRRRRRADYHDQGHASDIAHRRHRCHRSHRARPVVGSTKGIKVFKTVP